MKMKPGAPGLTRQEISKEKFRKVNVVLPEWVVEAISKEALRLRLTRSRLISEILQGYLRQLGLAKAPEQEETEAQNAKGES